MKQCFFLMITLSPTKIFFRHSTDFPAPGEPMPNATNDNNITRNDWVARGMNDSAGSGGIEKIENTSYSASGSSQVTVGSFISPPLVPHTISSGNWMIGGDYNESATNDNLNARYYVYGWLYGSDTN